MTNPQLSSQANIIRLPLLSQDLVMHGGKVMQDLMTKIEGIYGAGRRWTTEEIYHVHDLSQIPTAMEECELICRFYRSLGTNQRMFPHSVGKLLEKWTDCVDRARMSLKPIGVMKDPTAIQKRTLEAEMTLLRAQSFDEETKQWRADARAVTDRARFNESREKLKRLGMVV